MQRYRDTLPLDDPPQDAGDGDFVGVDMQRHPTKIAPGFVASARNCRFDERSADPRRGVGIVRHANSFATAFPLVFPIHFYVPAGLGEVSGVGEFSDPVGTVWTILATASTTFITRDGFPLEILSLPAGVTLADRVYFQQAGDVLYCFQGRQAPILAWRRELLAVAPWVSGWERLDTAPGDDGTLAIPPAESAIVKADRLLIPFERDQFVASDLLDFERYAGPEAVYSLDTGQAEKLVRLMSFGEQTVIAFKRPRGIYQITGVTGDLSAMNRADNPISTELGLAAFHSAVVVGADIFFLADTGVTSIRQVLDNKLQGKAEVLSEPIAPLLRRVNWQRAEHAVAAFWGRRYYLALPIDDATENNVVVVYDVEHKAWCGQDDGAAVHVKYFFTAQHHGRQRLHAVDYDGVVTVWEEHFEDETVDGWVGVDSEFASRGYLCGSADEKTFRRIALDVEGWNPTYSVGIEA